MDEMRRVMNEVRANAVVFDAALKSLSNVMNANHAEAREGIADVATSIEKLAQQQDKHAQNLGNKMTEVILGASAWKTSVDAATEVMERQFNEMQSAMADIADLKARVSALEGKKAS